MSDHQPAHQQDQQMAIQLNRPAHRQLVRWSDDYDKQLLCTIQWACNEAGLRIPWDLVAKQMGSKFTEGAIVQHLSKLRAKMAEIGLEVPPPLKRGTVNKPSKVYASGNKKRKGPGANLDDGLIHGQDFLKGGKPKRQRKKFKKDEKDSDLSDELESGSGSEYGASPPKKKARTSGKGKGKKTPTVNLKDQNVNVDDFALDAQYMQATAAAALLEAEVMQSIEKSPSKVRTRGIKHNYAKMNEGEDFDDVDDDEDQVDDEEYEEEDANTAGNVEQEISPLTTVRGRSGALELSGAATSQTRVSGNTANDNIAAPLEGNYVSPSLPYSAWNSSGGYAGLNTYPISNGMYNPTASYSSMSANPSLASTGNIGSFSSVASQLGSLQMGADDGNVGAGLMLPNYYPYLSQPFSGMNDYLQLPDDPSSVDFNDINWNGNEGTE